MNEEAWGKFRESRKAKKKPYESSSEENLLEARQDVVGDLLDRGFRVIKLEAPQGGLAYMKRAKYLNDPEYADLPDFIDARGTENGVGVYESTLDGGTFIKELPVGEFDKVYEID